MILLRKDSNNLNIYDYLNNLPYNNDDFAKDVLNLSGNLPGIPPIEIHPYLGDFELKNFEKYIIGTFPPISYIYDHSLLKEKKTKGNPPKIPFFHGNDFTFWECFFSENESNIFESIGNDRIQKKKFLIQLLIDSKVNYSDIIKSCRRSVIDSTDDSSLFNIIINEELIQHILNNPNAKFLNFNTSSIFNSKDFEFDKNGLLNDKNVQSLNLFIRSLQEMKFKIEISFDNFNYFTIDKLPNPHHFKVLFKLKISKEDCVRLYTINTTPSPSKQSSRGIGRNLIYQNWLQNQSQDIQKPTIKFRKYIYQLFRNNNWDDLQAMNINI